MSVLTDRLLPDADRILVLADDRPGRRRLQRRLGDAHDVVARAPGDDWGPFDLCLVDEATYPAVAERLAAARAEAEPGLLPVVLLVDDPTNVDAGGEDGAREVDDVLATSAPTSVLERRVETLLDARRRSLCLELERARFDAVAAGAGDGIVVADAGGTVVFVNGAAERLVGRPASAIRGGTVDDILSDVPDVGTTRVRARVVRNAEGPARAVEVSVVRFGAGVEAFVAYLVRDVTVREHSERERDRLVDLFERTQAMADVAGWEYDVAADDLLVTEHLRRLYAIQSPETLDMDTAIDGYHPADRDRVREAVERAVSAGEPFDLEVRLIAGGNDETWVRVLGERVDRADGDVVLRGTLQDVTDRVERERELEQLVDFLEDAQEIADLGTWEYDLQSDEFRLSSRTRDIFGFDPDADLSTEAALAPFRPDGRSALAETFERAVETDDPVDLELPFDHGGRSGWVRIHGRVRDEDGEPALIRGTVRDVTERVERTRELERAEVLVEESSDLNVILDEEGTFTYVSPSVERVLGYGAADLVGENAFEYVHPDDLEAAGSAFVRTITEPGSRPTVVVRFQRTDGTWADMEVTGRNLLDDPHVGGIVAYTRDVTERETRTHQLERYETIVQAAADPVYALDERGRFTLVNDAVLELTGESREALLGASVSRFLEADTLERGESLLADILAGDVETASVEVTVERHDGDRRRFDVRLSPLFDGDAFAGSVGVARDVTELRERERRLTVLDRVLRHNLRNKMNVVLGTASEIGDRSTDETIRERADTVRSAGEDLLSLSEAVRRFHDDLDPAAGPAIAGDLVEHVEAVVEESRIAHPEATVETDLPATAPARLPASIELALDELLENAVVHSDRAAPSVTVTVESAGDRVTVRVADDGPGLNPVERDALLAGVEGPLEHSSGLGLWLVRWTVDNVGGSLDIRDADPRGTVVELRFRSATTE